MSKRYNLVTDFYVKLLRDGWDLLSPGQRDALVVRRREAGGFSALVLLVCQLECCGMVGDVLESAQALCDVYGVVSLLGAANEQRRAA